jgi:lipoyl(octanoyl) transferase
MLQPKVRITDLGIIDYQKAWDYQEKIFQGIVDQKIARRHNPGLDVPLNHLFLCQHPHVFTIGKSGKEQHLLIDEARLASIGAEVYRTNRGGDITYHGPEQAVVYPLFDLDQFFTDIHKYLRYLEEAVILTLAEYGLQGDRSPGETGVWLDVQHRPRKICAMGVRASRWVTMHGLALNVNTNMQYFQYIVPCGIQNKAVTSMEEELGGKVPMEEVCAKLIGHLELLFGFERG